MDLSGRHAVVTGASRGIGVHVARALAQEGVVLTLAARSAPELAAVRDQIGGEAIAVPTDVSDESQRAALVDRAQSENGPIDILINNAGVEWASAYAEQAPAEIQQTMDINLTAPMLLTRAVLPSMVARRHGHIVNLASGAGKSGTPYEAAYAASKAGLIGFSQALRAELLGSGVGCSVICPGFVAGDGMYARMAGEGLHASAFMGVSPMAKVTAAVLNAIRKDRAEIIVNPTPLRPLLALQALAPGAQPRLMQLMGVTKLFRTAAEMRTAPPS